MKYFFLILTIAFLTPSLASAQDGSLPDRQAGLRIVTSPLPISLVAEPGTTITTELKVKNGGTEPETLKIDILKFNAYEDTGKPALHDLEPTDEFAKWVTFSEPTFTVLPEEWKTVTATFTVPGGSLVRLLLRLRFLSGRGSGSQAWRDGGRRRHGDPRPPRSTGTKCLA
ncbi:MAG: Fn3-like domain-containing protein [Candidatus Moraniibacteriota bacterium]|nr:MAG: Fn3-like domain-containing protein [Candidatus Moranbacteria bacterium]